MGSPGEKSTRLSILVPSACLSGLLLAMAFRSPGLHYLAWFALVPLFLALKRTSLSGAMVCSITAGLLFFHLVVWWVTRLEQFTPLAYFLLNLALSTYFALFGALASLFNRRIPRYNLLTFPATWVVLEYARTHAGFLSYPWGILGYSQYTFLPAAQISAFTGVLGISFLLVTVNTALAQILDPNLRRAPSPFLRDHPRHGQNTGYRWPLAALAGTLAVILSTWVLDHFLPAADKALQLLNVAVVQGNIDYGRIDTPLFSREVLQQYHDLSWETAPLKPDLIVWPSSSVPGTVPGDRFLVNTLKNLARETGAYLLVGSAGFDKMRAGRSGNMMPANSAFLFSPKGRITGRYDKVRLLPFDEYLPARGLIPWPSWIVNTRMTDSAAGRELTVFDMDGVRFGVQICWEAFFPDQFRRLSALNLHFMANQTNESFTQTPAAHYQMLAYSVIRAIENRITIIRTSSTGVSGVVGPDGRVTGRVRDERGADVNVQGFLVRQIPLSGRRSFYNRSGDWFVTFLLLSLAFFAVMTASRGGEPPKDGTGRTGRFLQR